MKPKIAIIMGSKSDFSIVSKATDMLDILGIPYSVNIYSAHRTPDGLDDYIGKIKMCDECKAIIAAAGMSAALAGVIASKTIKPVIGLPLSTIPIGPVSNINTITALLSTLQMPPGIPVLSVGVDAAKNAALAAAQIVALSDSDVDMKLMKYRNEQSDAVFIANSQLNNNSHEPFSSAELRCQCEF